MNDSKSIRSILLAAVLAILTVSTTSTPAFAVPNTATAQIAVSATVLSNCTISASGLAFGNYSGAVDNATATISVTCTNTTPYNVGLDAGKTSGATVTTRAMVGSGSASSATLPYALYQPSGTHTTNWGNTIGTDTVTGTGSGVTQTLTVYGQIAASQFVIPGSYSDTITATLTY